LPSYAETDYPHRAFGWSALRSLRSGKYLFVRAPEQELYDLFSDTAAKRNLAALSPAVAGTLSYQLDDFRKRTSSDQSTQEPSLSGEQQETLTALGYIAASPGARSKDPLQGPDPKSKVQFSNLLHEAMIAVEDGRFAEAVPMFEKVLADSPSISVAQMQMGTALARLRRYQEALVPLRKAVELMPDSVPAHYELGLALYETGAWQESAPHFELVAKKNPKMPDAQYSLASVYARTRRLPEALDLLRNVLAQNPQHFRANLLLGRILTLQDQPMAAVPYLEIATQVETDSSEAYAFLADAYLRAGRTDDAQQARRRAQSMGRQPLTPRAQRPE
jgi:tetratricopeptide (TPR) repeat protein